MGSVQYLKTVVIILGLLCLVLLPLVFDLGQFQTADEKRWLANVTNFTSQLSRGRIGHLLEQAHPGITTQWFAAPTVFTDSWTSIKLSLVVAEAILILLIGYTFFRLWGKWAGILIIVLLALNPLLVAHNRVYAMDALLALFSLLAISLLLLWSTKKETRYLVFSGAATAAAILSKLPGILLVPFSYAYTLYAEGFSAKTKKWVLLWTIACITAAILILPQLVIRPYSTFQDFFAFFSSTDYTELHPAGPWYYIRTLIFFTTPFHFLLVVAIPTFWKRFTTTQRRQLIVFLLFGLLFTIMMSAGSKKGDRYLLPAILMLDAAGALAASLPLRALFSKTKIGALGIALLLAIVFQGFEVARLHPYALSYVNPITKPLFERQRLGWGEGLDLAAEYLNAKPNAQELKVAAFYPKEFDSYFNGETIPLHQWDANNVDYAVLYRAQFERGESAWETDVLEQFATTDPEHIVYLNGLEYAWIYRLK